MKTNLKILFIFLLVFTTGQFSHKTIANEINPKMLDEAYACNSYYDAIRNSDDDTARSYYTYYIYNAFGFYLREFFDIENYRWEYDFKDGYYYVGNITTKLAAQKVTIGDKILKINGQKLKQNINWPELIFDERFDTLELELLNSENKIIKTSIERHKESWGTLRHSLREFLVTDIDLKKGTYTASVNEVFELDFENTKSGSEEPHILVQLAQNKIIYQKKPGDWTFHVCDPKDELFENRILQDPYNIAIKGMVKADKDYLKIKNRVLPFDKRFGNYRNQIVFQRAVSQVVEIKNDFNLRSFPFDKQYLKYEIVDKGFYHTFRIIEDQEFTYQALINFVDSDDIPGWEKKGYRFYKFLHKDVAQEEGTAYNGLGIEFELERKHGYYVYKVILPILLILSVCWSAVWIDPKELESRLTVTIVCLLSLIAYNFVIDSELPKLEYLTVLDWIILTSYVYAVIPNILSVISFRLQKMNNKVLCDRLETLSTRYGILSYFIIIFLIILICVNISPENSTSLISWMSAR